MARASTCGTCPANWPHSGHHVEVFSGQPYPELEPGPVLRTLPSLDLYREPDPFRTPKLAEYRDWIDVLEFLWMKTGGVPRAVHVQPPRPAGRC